MKLLSRSELKKLSLEELTSYFRKLRKYYYDRGDFSTLDNSMSKSKIKLFLLLVKLQRILSGRKLEILSDERIYNEKPKIYIVSHVGRFDIETAMEVIGEKAHLVMGDAEETYRNLDGYLLDLYGRILVDTGYQVYDDKEKIKNGEEVSLEIQKLIDEYKMDKKICYDTCVYHLKKGENIFIFPEGAWNITSHLCTRFFNGAAKMAIETGAEIIPVAICRFDDGKRYVVKVSENIDPLDFLSFQKLNEYLESVMWTLKWKIIEREGIVNRKEDPRGFDELKAEYVSSIMRESSNGYTKDVIERSRLPLEVDKPKVLIK